MAERRRVNIDRARVYKARGWSYDAIAKNQGVTTSAIYYALNKHKRRDTTSTGARRSVYIPDEAWGIVTAHARKYGLSFSSVVVSILEGELPDTTKLEPLLELAGYMTGPEIWEAASD